MHKTISYHIRNVIFFAFAAAALPGCSGVESEPVGEPTPEVEYELTEEELNAEQRR
jgi:hypothetical protein